MSEPTKWRERLALVECLCYAGAIGLLIGGTSALAVALLCTGLVVGRFR
jgi:hypothetical protein